MLAAFREWLKWRVAGAEMAELERWRVRCEEASRWLAEFHDAADVLDHLAAWASPDRERVDVSTLREVMRIRRAASERAARAAATSAPPPVPQNPAVIAALEELGCHIERRIVQPRAERRRRDDPPADGVRYQFLGVCGDER